MEQILSLGISLVPYVALIWLTAKVSRGASKPVQWFFWILAWPWSMMFDWREKGQTKEG